MARVKDTLVTIGWIGLGRMGGAMARHLLAAGYSVRGFDLSADALTRHRMAGGEVSSSAREAADGADIVVTMLNSDEALQSVMGGPHGLLEHLTTSQTMIDMSTSQHGTILRLAQQFKERGIDLLDAPVTGGMGGAEGAILDIMVGGDQATFERIQHIFTPMSRKVTYVGPSGSGLLAKYVNQIVMAATFCATSEALALVVKHGADPLRVYEAISSGLAASPLFATTVQAITTHTWGTGAELALFHKDTAYALAAATDGHAWLPMTAQAHEAFKLALGAGYGGGSAPGVAQVWEQIMDVRLNSDES